MSKVLQKACKELRMVTAEAALMVRELAAPSGWTDNRKSGIARVARLLGWTYARTSNVLYGRARLIRAEEWITLNDRFDALKRADNEHRDGANELHAALRDLGNDRLGDRGMARREGEALARSRRADD